MCSLNNNKEIIVCREPGHDQRLNGYQARITHACLLAFYRGGKKYFSVLGICERCYEHITKNGSAKANDPVLRKKIGPMPIREALRMRDLQKELNQKSTRSTRPKPHYDADNEASSI